jgi:hypothetical protein
MRPATGKCLHYYFYFIDAELGLIYLRVPTWCPFRLQFYCNGHSWLARQLTAAGIGFKLADNAFLHIDDWPRAQTLADHLSPTSLHHILDRYAQQCCPVLDVFAQSYHWSFMQVEYATDLVFRSQAVLKPRPSAVTLQHRPADEVMAGNGVALDIADAALGKGPADAAAETGHAGHPCARDTASSHRRQYPPTMKDCDLFLRCCDQDPSHISESGNYPYAAAQKLRSPSGAASGGAAADRNHIVAVLPGLTDEIGPALHQLPPQR